MCRSLIRSVFAFAVVVLLVDLVAVPAWSQKPPPGSQAPTLNAFLPIGLQRGQVTELVLTGTNLAGPTGFSLGTAAEITIPMADKNGQDNTKLKVQLKVPAQTPLGLYPLRLATKRGLSNYRLVAVDDLPQLVKNEKNTTRETAQAIAVPCAVSGRIDAEQANYYRITVAAGQRLSFDVLGRRLGSPLDAELTILHGKTFGMVAYDNDSPGCQGDPRLSYTFKEAGDYVIKVNDVTNKGGPEHVYRLRVGDFPLATTPLPLAARRGTKAKIGFAGPYVEGAAPVDVTVGTDPATVLLWVAPKGPNGLSGWPVALALSDHDELVEAEPNHEPAKANRIPVPGGITGRFQKTAELDYYIFAAKKGQKLLIEAQTLEMYTPTLVEMVLKNAKTGAEIAKTNPQAAPPADQRIDFTAADDGDVILEVRHLYYAGGPSEVYRVTVTPSTPGFDLVLPLERFELSPGSFAPIPVTVARRGYNGPIELSVAGLPPGLTGTATVKAGQTAAAVVVQAKDDQPMGVWNATVLGKAVIDGKPVTQAAIARGPHSQTLNALPYPPLDLNLRIALGVKEKGPFSLAIKMNPPGSVPGIPGTVTITATRDKGFVDDITINPPLNLPANVAPPKVPNIAKDKTEVSFPLDLNPKAPMGDYAVLFSAKTKTKEGELYAAALPLDVVIGPPFELKVEPPVFSLSAGEKAKLKVTATRRGGYKGPIAVDLRKLPANVTVGKVSIAADQTMVEVEIAAAPNAAVGDKADVDVLGTATALNNLQNASPVFTVRIQKK
jgi:hypothetical protein